MASWQMEITSKLIWTSEVAGCSGTINVIDVGVKKVAQTDINADIGVFWSSSGINFRCKLILSWTEWLGGLNIFKIIKNKYICCVQLDQLIYFFNFYCLSYVW